MADNVKGVIISNLVEKLPPVPRLLYDIASGRAYNGTPVFPKKASDSSDGFFFNGAAIPRVERGDPGLGYYLKNPTNADRFKPSNTPPRQKFNGYVNFCFNDHVKLESAFANNADFKNRLSSMVKTSTMPSAEFATTVQNQYNRKRITIASVDYKPIQVVVYDTVDSIWVTMLMKMYAHLFTNPTNMYKGDTKKIIKNDVVPESVLGATGSFNRPFNSNDAGLNLQPGDQRNFITSIDIVQYHGQRAIMHTLFNPLITSFEIDGIDYADSSACTITLDIAYENFTINPDINAFISKDDLERFSDFNQDKWHIGTGREPGTSAPRHEQGKMTWAGAGSIYPLQHQNRKASFLNDVFRKEQATFLDSFSKTSEGGTGPAGAGTGPDAGTGTSSGTYTVGGKEVSKAEYDANLKRLSDFSFGGATGAGGGEFSGGGGGGFAGGGASGSW